ncbi:MAG: serine racemase VanT catalytic subunit [Eubacterium sp.]|nr:serine racemase VanT catalytic subunit [Eubacterium sp.]
MYQKGRAWIELNMENLLCNVKQLQALLPAHCAIMPAVKANAYGHGARLISQALQETGIRNFCVASVSEAIELRNAGIDGQILVLCYTTPYQFSDLVEYDLIQTVVDYSYARQLNSYGKPMCVHVGIDTGMHRLGEPSSNMETIRSIWNLKNLKITGVFSHLCVSDGTTETERDYTLAQIQKFQSVIRFLHQNGIYGFKQHLQGSYGVLNYPHLSFDYARIGIALYGAYSSPGDKTIAQVNLKPVLALKARIECVKPLHTGESVGYGLDYTAVKEMKIAAVSIGYADGIPRGLSNRGYVLINGQKADIIGRICMDQLLIDVSEISSAAAGDEVVLIGKCKEQEITAGDFAERAGTISNEILSRLGKRLERVAV